MGGWRGFGLSFCRAADGGRALALAVALLAALALGGCSLRDEGPSGRGPQAAAPLDPRFGIASGGAIEFASRRDVARELDGYVALGAGWLRFDMKWEIVEERRGRYEWARYDRLVSEARSRGLRLVATITYAPEWARPGGSDNRIDPRRYARFAAAVVRRYSPRIRHFELWNEPNLRTFWEPSPNAVVYAELVKAAYAAMKEVEPDVTVLAGSLAPVGGYQPGCRGGVPRIQPVTFLRRMYARGAGGSFDALSYHPYTDGSPAGRHRCNAWRQLGVLRRLMEAAGDGSKQIWATEFGAHVSEVGEAGQAARIREALELWPRYPWAGPLMAYTYRDPAGEGFSLVRRDWSRRPAWHAYRAAVAAAGSRP